MQTKRNYRKPPKRFLQKTAYDVYIWRKVPTPSVAMTADAEVVFFGANFKRFVYFACFIVPHCKHYSIYVFTDMKLEKSLTHT
jgi:hypothetical protein